MTLPESNFKDVCIKPICVSFFFILSGVPESKY